MPTVNEIIVKTANEGLDLQESNGSMPAGHNGPYHDPETPVRNTAHWSITFTKAYEISGDEKFKQSVEDCRDYLLQKRNRPYGKTFHHRRNPSKDLCNGLIGQAWVIEALCRVSDILPDKRVLEVAKSVFKYHTFDQGSGLWDRVEIDGSSIGLDMTFNHQLWFAMAGGMLESRSESSELRNQLKHFLDMLSRNLNIYGSGLIQHHIDPTLSNIANQFATGDRLGGKSFLRTYIGKSFLYRAVVSGISNQDMIHKAVGYHSFNLYAFAILHNLYSNHPFWRSTIFQQICRYSKSDSYLDLIEQNKFAYPYNPPGFELSHFWETTDSVGQDRKLAVVKKQLKKCYDPESNLMEANTEDSATHAARIYEATRLPNWDLGPVFE